MKKNNNIVIHLENVHKAYIMGKEAVPALRGVSLDVFNGEFLCLMGPSGSGKTTLLNLIGGLDSPSRGHITIDGANIIEMSEDALAKFRMQKLGFIFQEYNLLENLTAFENIEVPLVLAKVKRKKRRKRVEKLLQLVDMSDREKHYPSELSGGQQQRVAIARALANNPSILVADEITGELDSETGFEIMKLVSKLNKDNKTTVVFVTHDPRMADFAERTLYLEDGQLKKE